MTVTLTLRRIDHQLTVVDGLAAVNAAIATRTTDPLVDYISGIPFTPDKELVETSKSRISRLSKVNAPTVVIENERRLETLINGTAYSRESLLNQSFDELRRLIGQWGWFTSSCSLQDTWCALDWFMQPQKPTFSRSTEEPRPSAGDPRQTILDQVLHGAFQSPLDSSGNAAIVTCGTEAPDCFGYNPPFKVTEIVDALNSIDAATFSDYTKLRQEIYIEAMPDLSRRTIEDIVDGELEAAQMAFPLVVKFYLKANGLNRGVACEYSL